MQDTLAAPRMITTHFPDKYISEFGKNSSKSKDLMLIARIESFILNKNLDDALKRSDAYVDAGADGIMIEAHPNPTKAAVDPLQPISFVELSKLMKKMNKIAKLVYNRKVI